VAYRIEPSTLNSFLSGAGEERFGKKVESYRGEMEREGAGQVLYRGIMGALGYARNKALFMELARRVPLYALEKEACNGALPESERILKLQTIMNEAGGLAPAPGEAGRPMCRGD
jgi:hypothetical protein